MIRPLLLGICLTCLGIFSLKRYHDDQKKDYVIVPGIVVRLDKTQKCHRGFSSIGFVPVFEYTYRGTVYQKEHRVQSSKYGKGMGLVPASKYRPGDSVELRVYTDHPEYAIINESKNIKSPLYLGIPLTISGPLLAIAAVLFWGKG